MKNLTTLFLIILLVSLWACKQEELSVPENFQTLADPENVELGRVLFYDKQLSINNSISCASCHKQAFAFADNVQFSRGFNNRLTTRNSPPIQNIGNFHLFAKSIVPGPNDSLTGFLFWDGRESDLTRMVLKPVVNHIEMGFGDLFALSSKLEKIPYYPPLFERTFNSPGIDPDRISRALAVFVGSIGGSSKFDRQELDEKELLGATLFVDKYRCNDCHQIHSPTGYQNTIQGGFANIGLVNNNGDQGRGGITGRQSDIGKFKIPSLRNVALTAPYMHDGRFKTLDEVFDHYKHGMVNDDNLDFTLKDEYGNPKRFEISEREQEAMISFLNTLTSASMLTNPLFSDPFITVSK